MSGEMPSALAMTCSIEVRAVVVSVRVVPLKQLTMPVWVAAAPGY